MPLTEYRYVAQGPGGELDGGSQEPPPSGGGKSRDPAGRWLKVKERFK